MRTYLRLFVLIAFTTICTAAFAENPWVGTWKLDPSQSKFTGDTIRFASSPGGEMTYSAGGHATQFKMDGQQYKTWSGAEVTWKKVDDTTFESHMARNGVDMGTTTWTLSANGITLKSESKGTRPDGSSFDDSADYQRTSGSQGLAGSWKSTKADMNEEQEYVIAEKGPNELSWTIPEIKGVLTATLDGKDAAPVGPTVPQGLTISLLRVSPRSLKFTEKMNGEPTYRSTMTISADGKKMTDIGSPAKVNEPTTAIWIKQ